jgi:hypothetical protein
VCSKQKERKCRRQPAKRRRAAINCQGKPRRTTQQRVGGNSNRTTTKQTDKTNQQTPPHPPPTTHTNAVPPSPPPPSTNITILKYPPKRGGRPNCRRRGPVKAGSRPTPTTYRSEWGASLRALSLLSKTWPHQTLPTIPHATHASTSTNPRAAPPNKPQLRVARVRGLSQIPAQG